MNLYESLYPQLEAIGLGEWSQQLRQSLPEMFALERRREMADWHAAIKSLPQVRPTGVELKDRVEIGRVDELDEAGKEALVEKLKAFYPWRKGPFRLFGIDIDTE